MGQRITPLCKIQGLQKDNLLCLAEKAPVGKHMRLHIFNRFEDFKRFQDPIGSLYEPLPKVADTEQ